MVSYSAAIGANADGTQWEGAHILLCEMTHKILTPDEVSYTAAIPACQSVKLWDRILQLLQEMLP